MLPSIWTVMKEVISSPETFNAAGVKVGVTLNVAGASTVVASAVDPQIFGATLDEWKVIGLIVGIICSVVGVIVQITFKTLERRDRNRRDR